jgi:Na+/melibiose symporter-like transporter
MSLVYAVNTLAAKIAGAGAILLTFPLLQFLGFNAAEGAVNTRAAIHHLDMAFLLGPIVFVMLGGVCVIGWRLDAARHGEIRAQLEARDAELESAAALRSSLSGIAPDPSALVDKTSLTA